MGEATSYNVLLVRVDGVEGGRDEAVRLLAEHFRLTAAEADRIIDSVPVVVRKRADEDASNRLVARLREMGFEARRIAAGTATSQRAASITGILKPVRRKTGDHDAIAEERRRRRTTGAHVVPSAAGERRAKTTGEHVTVRASRERLRRLSGQFATVGDVTPSPEPDATAGDAQAADGPSPDALDAIAATIPPARAADSGAADAIVSDASVAAASDVDVAPAADPTVDPTVTPSPFEAIAPEPEAPASPEPVPPLVPVDAADVDAPGASASSPGSSDAAHADDADASSPFGDATRFDEPEAGSQTTLSGGALDVDVDARTLAPSPMVEHLAEAGAESAASESDAPSADVAGATTEAPAQDPNETGGFHLTGNSLDDTATPHGDTVGLPDAHGTGVDPELTSALDEIAADLPRDEPWPDVTGLSEIPVQTPRGGPPGSAPPPPVGGGAPPPTSDDVQGAGDGLTDFARRSSVLDEMMAIDDENDFGDAPSIDDVIAGNAPIPSPSRSDIGSDDMAPGDDEDAPLELTHTSLEDSLNDISGAQGLGSTGPTAAVSAGRPTAPNPRVRVPARAGGGGAIRLLVGLLIVVAVGGIGFAIWWTMEQQSTDGWKFEHAPRHYEMVEIIDGAEARSSCAVVEPGRELCRYSAEHLAPWFPGVDSAVTATAASSCYAWVDVTSTTRRRVFSCTVRTGEGPDRQVWSLTARETRECSAPPGSLQPGETAECTTRSENTATRNGEAAMAPFTDTRPTLWEFDRLRESFSTNVGYFRVAELRVRPADAASGLPVMVAWALDIDRVVERYRPDGTMIEEIVYIREPTRRVGNPELSPAPPTTAP